MFLKYFLIIRRKNGKTLREKKRYVKKNCCIILYLYYFSHFFSSMFLFSKKLGYICSMISINMERREFLKTTAGAGLAFAGANLFAYEGANESNNYDAKGLPTTTFGSTGVLIPKIVLGLGSRFCHIDSNREAFEMLNYALDNGFYYWDTAHTYDNTIALPPWKNKPTELVISEVRVGEVVKTRRKEIFLSTKVQAREPSEAMKQIELSLKRLHTDHLDMLKIHGVETMDEVNKMSQRGGVIDILMRLKEEKVTRFIGFSCHVDNEMSAEMTRRATFDSMLIAMNHYRPEQKPLGMAFPAAKEKKMGLLLMKSVRPRETVEGLNAVDLIKYALSLDGPDALVLGMDSIDVVKSNLEILRNFQKLPPQRMQELALHLAPFYRHENLPWMQKGYTDGNWKC